MSSLPILEHLDIFEGILSRLFLGHIASMVHRLTLEGPEEAVDTGSVPAITVATHAGNKTVFVKDTLVARGGILSQLSCAERDDDLPERNIEVEKEQSIKRRRVERLTI